MGQQERLSVFHYANHQLHAKPKAIYEHHSLVFVDFRRLAAKKALASSRNSFSSLRRRIFLSCSFTHLCSILIFSARPMSCQVYKEPPPISNLPVLTAFASFTACTLNSGHIYMLFWVPLLFS